ncbi:MAG TPA: phosphoadenylyl-sulfate reductase [Baekduia sp.]|nr:phosphoadenylyl-sulfate reductase [Baekduia sp.]
MRGLSAQLTETLGRAAQHERPVLLCSFQKEESVLLDELLRVDGARSRVRVVTIDTGVLFPETLETWKRFEDHFGVRVEVEDASDPASPWTGPQHCCSPHKVDALQRALGDADAWITGIRREQAETRAHAELAEVDAARGIAKYNPLAYWSEKDLWTRIFDRGLPYHPLHDEGYASIGCACCTLPGDGREGRWAGTEKTECGLHVATTTTDELPVL